MKNEISLYDHKQTARDLTEDQITAMVALFGSRCRQATKDRLYRRLKWISILPYHGIFNRVMIGENSCHYVAGQSYPDEIRCVRELILKG